MLAEPLTLLKSAITISEAPPPPVPLVGQIFIRENAEAHLHNAVR
jgi:hypothetical protein